MHHSDIQAQIEALSSRLDQRFPEARREPEPLEFGMPDPDFFSSVLTRLSDAVNAGFAETNSHLDRLEGYQGIQGAYAELQEIKKELRRISHSEQEGRTIRGFGGKVPRGEA